MSKKVFFKVAVALVFVAAAVVWLLSVVMPDKFNGMNLAWVIAAACGALGLIFVLRGVFEKNLTFVKKLNIFVGVALLVAAALALVGSLIPGDRAKLALPIVAIGITVAALILIIAVGGKKWDTADNQKVGYKTYRERKENGEKF